MDNRKLFEKIIAGLLNDPARLATAQQTWTDKLFGGGSTDEQLYKNILREDYQSVKNDPFKEGFKKPISTAASIGASMALPFKAFQGSGALNTIKSPLARGLAKGVSFAGTRGLESALGSYGGSKPGQEGSSAALAGLLGFGLAPVEVAVSKVFKPDYLKTFRKGLNTKTTGLNDFNQIDKGVLSIADKMKKSTNTGAFTLEDIINNKNGIKSVIGSEVSEVGKDVPLAGFKNKIDTWVQNYLFKDAANGKQISIVKSLPMYKDFMSYVQALPESPTLDQVHELTWMLNEMVGGYGKMEAGGTAAAQAAKIIRNNIFKDIAETGSKTNNQLIKQALDKFGESQALQGALKGMESVANQARATESTGAGLQALLLGKGMKGASTEAQLRATGSLSGKGGVLSTLIPGLEASLANTVTGAGGESLPTDTSVQPTTGGQGGLSYLFPQGGFKGEELQSRLNQYGSNMGGQQLTTKDKFLQNMGIAASMLPEGTASQILAMAKELTAIDDSEAKSTATTTSVGAYIDSGRQLPIKLTIADQSNLQAYQGIQDAINFLAQNAGSTGKLAAIGGKWGEFTNNPTQYTQIKNQMGTSLTGIKNALIGANMTEKELEGLNFPTAEEEPKVVALKLNNILQYIRNRPLGLK